MTFKESLRHYFSVFGKVTKVLLVRNPNTQKSRGFGFVTFSDPNAVDLVLKQEHYLDGRRVCFYFKLRRED